MSFAEFAESVKREAGPPSGATAALRGLWHDGRGDWARAHTIVQEDSTAEAAWVHAYLHRKEGDAANAGYWYARAKRTRPASDVTLATEWEQIVRELLGDRKDSVG